MRTLFFLISLTLFYGCDRRVLPLEVKLDLSGIEIIAHRGGPGILYPENSLSAIRNSLENNVDGIEIDIRLTKDRKIVVLHDETINRTTTGEGNVGKFTLEELKQFDLLNGSGERTDQKIPTLDEVVKLIDGKAELFVEPKEYSDQMLSELLAYLEENDLYQWVKIISYSQKNLLRVSTQNQKIETGNIVYSETGHIELRGGDISFLKYLFVDYRALDNENVKELSQSKKKVYVYTLNNINDMSEKNYLWVNGIVTDEPDYWIYIRGKK